MIRVLIDTGNAPPYTGIGVYSQGLLDALRCYGNGELLVQENQISSNVDSVRPLGRLQYFWGLKQLRKRNYDNADIVHFTNVYVPKRSSRIAFIGTIHDIDALVYPETYSKQYRVYFNYIVRMALERANIILTDTDAMRQQILNYFKIPEECIQAIGIGLPAQFIRIADNTLNEPVADPPMVLFVGSLSVKKNTPWLIHSIDAGMRSGALPTLRLVLAGTAGFGFHNVLDELKKSSGNIQWVEKPSLEQLVRLYKQASVVVLPSRTEGFGIPLIEAMYCKKNIVASCIPSSLEVASHVAYFFELDNVESFYTAINTALTTRSNAQQDKFLHEHLLQYRWETLVEKYISAYKEAFSRR